MKDCNRFLLKALVNMSYKSSWDHSRQAHTIDKLFVYYIIGHSLFKP